MTDSRSIDALDVAEKYANGKATEKERAAAGEAATWVGRLADMVALATDPALAAATARLRAGAATTARRAVARRAGATVPLLARG